MDTLIVVLCTVHVLCITVTDHTNGSHPHTDQITVTVCRVALEVAPERAVALCDGELIIRFGEVIHADIDIASLGQ